MSSPISSALEHLDGDLQNLATQVGRLAAGLDVDEDQLNRSLAEVQRTAATIRDLIRVEQPTASWKDRGSLDRLIHELEVVAQERRVQQRRNRLVALAAELEAGHVKHRVESRANALNGLRLEAVRELRQQAASPQLSHELPGPDAGQWLHWACNLQEESDGASLEALRNNFPGLEHFLGEMEENYWVPGEASYDAPPVSAAPPPAPVKPAAPPPPPPAAVRASEPDKGPHIVRPQAPKTMPAAAAYAEPPSVAVAQTPRRTESSTWQAAAVAVAREPVPAPAPAPPPQKKYCDECDTEYPGQFKLCPIHGSQLRAVLEPIAASPVREKGSIAATAAAAVAEPRPAAAPAPKAEAPVQPAKQASAAPAVKEAPKPQPKEQAKEQPKDKQAKDAKPAKEAKKEQKQAASVAVKEPPVEKKPAEDIQTAENKTGAVAWWDEHGQKLAANPIVVAAAGLLLFAILVVAVVLMISHKHSSAPSTPVQSAAPAETTAPVAAGTPAPTATAPAPPATTGKAQPEAQPKQQQNADNRQQQAREANGRQAEVAANNPPPRDVLSLPAPSPNPVKKEQPANDNVEPPTAIPGALPGASGNVNDVVKGIPVAVPSIAGQKVRISSGVAQAQLIKQVPPQYPNQARDQRVQGTVVLQALIGKDGSVQSVHVVSGPPVLTKAAMEAVKQWRYRPFAVDGEPVEADTQIKLKFSLGQ